MSKRTKLILGGVIGLPIVLFLAIQLIPVWLLQNNPPVIAEPAWDSPETRALAQRACFDCHSNETAWPWYSRVAPVSWLITFDTIRGRRNLNFSEWGGEREGVEDIAELINNGEMPPANYLPLHPEASLTEAEKQQLIAGLQASLK